MPVAVSNTAYGIIKDAMMDAGYLQEGQDPNSEQLSTNLRRLCDIINLWQTEGIKLFLHQEVAVPLLVGINSYTVNPSGGTFPQKNLKIIQGRVQGPSLDRRTINALSWQEWNMLSQASSGVVTGYFVDKQATSLVVKVWNTPDAQEALNSMVLLVLTQASNPFNLEADVSFPQEWRIALRWGLADDICTGQPAELMARCDRRAQTFKAVLEGWDVEDTSTTFAVASGYYSDRNFS
jgi:hypothetical protein